MILPWMWVDSSATCTDQFSNEYSRGRAYKSPDRATRLPLFSSSLHALPLFCPVISSFLGFPELQAPSLQVIQQVLHMCHCPALQLENFLQAVSWDNHREHFICFLLIRSYCSLPDVQYLECYFFLYFMHFLYCCFRCESKSCSSYSPHQKLKFQMVLFAYFCFYFSSFSKIVHAHKTGQ